LSSTRFFFPKRGQRTPSSTLERRPKQDFLSPQMGRSLEKLFSSRGWLFLFFPPGEGQQTAHGQQKNNFPLFFLLSCLLPSPLTDRNSAGALLGSSASSLTPFSGRRLAGHVPVRAESLLFFLQNVIRLFLFLLLAETAFAALPFLFFPFPRHVLLPLPHTSRRMIGCRRDPFSSHRAAVFFSPPPRILKPPFSLCERLLFFVREEDELGVFPDAHRLPPLSQRDGAHAVDLERDPPLFSSPYANDDHFFPLLFLFLLQNVLAIVFSGTRPFFSPKRSPRGLPFSPFRPVEDVSPSS